MSVPRSKSAPELLTQVTLPDNAAYTWLFDSTDARNFDSPDRAAFAKTAGVRTVGPARGRAKNLIIKFGVSCATNDCTVVQYTLDGAGAWKLYASTAIVAAASPQHFVWTTPCGDVLIGILAGATAPSAIATTLHYTEA